MIIFEFSKNFYRNLYLLLAFLLVISGVFTIYLYNRNVFDITQIQTQLNQGAAKVFHQNINWSYANSQLIGEISLNNNNLIVTYYLSKKNIGYKMVEQDSHSILQLPCLNILHVLPVRLVKLMYKKLLASGMDYKISKNIEVKKGLHVEYTYNKKQQKIFTTCNIYYE